MFEQRAVAFLDILGFKDFLKQAEADRQKAVAFQDLIHLIESHIRWSNARLAPSVPDAVKPKYLFISDSIVLSAPLHEQRFDGLAVISQTCIQLSHKLLETGFLVKGGISVGSAWHQPTNIFGSAYIEAYLLHEKVRGPTIELTGKAIDHMAQAIHITTPLTQLGLWQTHRDGRVTADALHTRYIQDEHQDGRIDFAFSQYRSWISTRQSELTRNSAAWEKWEMMRHLFNDARKRHSVNVDPL